MTKNPNSTLFQVEKATGADFCSTFVYTHVFLWLGMGREIYLVVQLNFPLSTKRWRALKDTSSLFYEISTVVRPTVVVLTYEIIDALNIEKITQPILKL